MIACSIHSSVVAKTFKCPPKKNFTDFFSLVAIGMILSSDLSCERTIKWFRHRRNYALETSLVISDSNGAVASNRGFESHLLSSKRDTAELSWTIWLPLSPKDNIESSRNQTQDLSVVLLQCQPGQSHKAKHIVTALKDWNSMFSLNSRF